ncbi:helix-turn-helix domain-containing protein [Arthrobacter sp. 2MCAF15]|uniref:helix-turn-helix domain-containing protein n=1 Tax=Arthrobacter sp. 2MCAF15 TaxID=3232984 RepID=UPI003F92C9B1
MKERSDRTAELLRGWLKALASVGSAVNRGISKNDLLNMVAKTACELMGYDFCSVTVPDAASAVLLIEGSHGLSDDYIRNVNATHPIRLQGTSLPSPSSQAFTLGIPIQIENTGSNPSFGPWATAAHDQGFTSMIAIPLNAPSGTLGTLNCFTRLTHHFESDEISLLTVLADQVALAMNTARVRAEQARIIAELKSLNENLEDQYDLQRKVGEVHHRLTSLALRGGDTADVGAALAELLDRSVVVQSGHGTAVCGSTVDTSDLLEALAEKTTYQNQRFSGHGYADTPLSDVQLPQRDGSSTPAVRAPVVVREEVVAWIWTTGSVADLTPLDQRAIEHAATVMALELLSARSAADTAWHRAGEILAELLNNQGPLSSSLLAQAESLGHDLSQPHAMIVAQHNWKRTNEFQNRLADTVARLLGESRPQPLVGMYQDHVVALWPLGREALESARHIAEEIRRTLTDGEPSVDSPLSVLTGPVGDPAIYPEAFSIARGAVELARLRGLSGQTLLVNDLGMAGLFLQVPDTVRLHSYCEEILGPLRRHDSSRGTELVRTLSVLVLNNLDAQMTADQLSADTGTVLEQRRLIEEILGCELTNVAAMTHISTALQLDEVFTATRA